MFTKATKPIISTTTWPASRDDWHRYTALEIHAGVADIFSGKPRADCLPRVPLRNEVLPARYGGTPMFATGAAGNAEFATAMRKCFEDTTKFEEQERKAIAAGLTFCKQTPGSSSKHIQTTYAATVATNQLDTMITVFSEALTGSSAYDKAHITDEVLATASEGDCSDDPSDDHQSYLTLSTATPLLLHTETPSTSVRFLLDSGASNNITNNVTLARSFNFKKLEARQDLRRKCCRSSNDGNTFRHLGLGMHRVPHTMAVRAGRAV